MQCQEVFADLMKKLHEVDEALVKLRRNVFVISLLQHYCPQSEIAKLCFVQLYTPVGRQFYTFTKSCLAGPCRILVIPVLA